MRTLEGNAELLKRYEQIMLGKSKGKKEGQIDGNSHKYLQGVEDPYRVTGWDTKYAHGKVENENHNEEILSQNDPHESNWNNL